MNVPELLSPAGSPQALDAALDGGADAVYLGGTVLNARMNAANFDDGAMVDAVSRSHRRGVKIYVTLNTAVYDRELDEVVRYAKYLYDIGIDALIVADIGLARLIHRYMPAFELHASTQAFGHNADAARVLAEAGFSRMVCARELSIENMRSLCVSSPIEIEAFVHGAHCVSYSGQCLFSSMVGGRSGNRGECAQPCRMKYKIMENGGENQTDNEYPLSLRDMCLAAHITELGDIGVRSLKIEGRMKSPDYVYAVTSVYRRLLDEGRNADENELREMARVFSRGGFTDGYFVSDTSDMLGVRADADKDATRRYVSLRSAAVRSLPEIEISRPEVRLPERISFRDGADSKHRAFRRMTAQFMCASQIPSEHMFDNIYLPLGAYDAAAAKVCGGVILPAVMTDSEREGVLDAVRTAVSLGAREVMAQGIGQIPLCRELKKEFPSLSFCASMRFNITNSQSRSSPVYSIFRDMTASPELSVPQLRDMCGIFRTIVYGKMPLMLLERPCGAKTLTDRTGAKFPVLRVGGRDVVVNCVPTYMADKADELRRADIAAWHFIFTTETRDEVRRVEAAYKAGFAPKFAVRRIK